MASVTAPAKQTSSTAGGASRRPDEATTADATVEEGTTTENESLAELVWNYVNTSAAFVGRLNGEVCFCTGELPLHFKLTHDRMN